MPWRAGWRKQETGDEKGIFRGRFQRVRNAEYNPLSKGRRLARTYGLGVQALKHCVVLAVEPQLAQSRLDFVRRISPLVNAHKKTNCGSDGLVGHVWSPALLRLLTSPLHLIERAVADTCGAQELFRSFKLDILSSNHPPFLVLFLPCCTATQLELIERATSLKQCLANKRGKGWIKRHAQCLC